MRVASVTVPFFIGTLRSTRTSTRLPSTFCESIVLKSLIPNSSWFPDRCLAFPDHEHQHIAVAGRGDQFVAGLPAIGGKILLGGRIGRAHGQQAAHRQL